MVFRTGFIAVILSFCSLTYELLLAKSFTLITDNMVFAQTVSVGLYLLGIGLGVYLQKDSSDRDSRFFQVEIILSFLGLLIPFYTYGVNGVVEVFVKAHIGDLFTLKLILFSCLAIFIGIFTGKEFMYLTYRGRESNTSLNLVLASTYFGNLIGGLAFPLVLYRPLGLMGTCVLISGINLTVAFFVVRRLLTVKKTMVLLIGSAVVMLISQKVFKISNILKSASYTDIATTGFGPKDIKNIWYYFKKEAPSVESYRSKYQDIDLVSFSKNETVLYLNRKPQFSTQNYKSYHRSMLEGFINLHGSVPQKALILGGGDGILARYLLERGVNSIKIIDLDPFITHLAKTHETFVGLNHGSLLDSRVDLVNGDAFSYMMKTNEQFEAIFIDFPLPTHLDLSKLYSVEFYKKVFLTLTKKGSVIFDSPAKIKFEYGSDHLESSSINLITKTLSSAGIVNSLIFGPYEAFGFFTKQIKEVQFDYDKFPSSLPGFVFMNMIDFKTYVDVIPSENANSIFKPLRYK